MNEYYKKKDTNDGKILILKELVNGLSLRSCLSKRYWWMMMMVAILKKIGYLDRRLNILPVIKVRKNFIG